MADETSPLVDYAEREMRKAGLFDADADYGGAAGKAVLELVKVFASQGHSGGSAGLVLSAFGRVVRFQPLSPLTSNPDEWMEVGHGVWQSNRQSDAFSTDGGKNWYSVDDPKRELRPSEAASR